MDVEVWREGGEEHPFEPEVDSETGQVVHDPGYTWIETLSFDSKEAFDWHPPPVTPDEPELAAAHEQLYAAYYVDGKYKRGATYRFRWEDEVT